MRGVASRRRTSLLSAALALPVVLTSLFLAPVAAAAPADESYRPDASIKVRGVGGWGGWGSAASASRGVGRGVVFVLRVRNDGDVPDHFFVDADASEPGFRVRFLVAGVEAQGVQAGAYLTDTLAPGQHVRILIRVRVRPGAAPGAVLERLVTVTSAGSALRVDEVAFSVTRL